MSNTMFHHHSRPYECYYLDFPLKLRPRCSGFCDRPLPTRGPNLSPWGHNYLWFPTQSSEPISEFQSWGLSSSPEHFSHSNGVNWVCVPKRSVLFLSQTRGERMRRQLCVVGIKSLRGAPFVQSADHVVVPTGLVYKTLSFSWLPDEVVGAWFQRPCTKIIFLKIPRASFSTSRTETIFKWVLRVYLMSSRECACVAARLCWV